MDYSPRSPIAVVIVEIKMVNLSTDALFQRLSRRNHVVAEPLAVAARAWDWSFTIRFVSLSHAITLRCDSDIQSSTKTFTGSRRPELRDTAWSQRGKLREQLNMINAKYRRRCCMNCLTTFLSPEAEFSMIILVSVNLVLLCTKFAVAVIISLFIKVITIILKIMQISKQKIGKLFVVTTWFLTALFSNNPRQVVLWTNLILGKHDISQCIVVNMPKFTECLRNLRKFHGPYFSVIL